MPSMSLRVTFLKKLPFGRFNTGHSFISCVLYSEHKATVQGTIMSFDRQFSASERSAIGPQHIGELLPQVLARYGIATSPENFSISSARLRRRMSGAARSRSNTWQRS